MKGERTTRRFISRYFICFAFAGIASVYFLSSSATAAVVISDGFGDADRNNDGAITFYDTDINDSGTWNDYDLAMMTGEDYDLASRGIFEVTAAQDANDMGIVWSGTRSYDTAANIPKARLRIINDDVATGSETEAEIHNSGLALGVESRGGGSSFIGRFGQAIDVGPEAGDKVVASVDFRAWREADSAFTPPDFNEFRWGLYEDTDDELGMTGPFGVGFVSSPPGATVEWGKDDGNWFAQQPGAEGDKGIRAQLTFGSLAGSGEARIQWEYNLAGINGTANNGRILEGTGVSDTPGTGGDTGTVANPSNPEDGPGGIIQGGTYASHTLKLEVVRLANGLIEVASFVDGVEVLRDDIKDTDTGYSVLGPPAFSYDYVAFRNSADFDYVIDNFMVEIFGSNEGLDGDYNADGKVDAADYAFWRKNDGTQAGYDLWRANFGAMAGSGSGGVAAGTVPEPTAAILLLIGGSSAFGYRWSGRKKFVDNRIR
jgi:hypothetical protein